MIPLATASEMSLQKSPDDPRLVEMAMSLGQQLQVPKLEIEEVRWTEWIRPRIGRRQDRLLSGDSRKAYVPSDWCLFRGHAMIMPARMMGRLTVEEWRPLIVSSILFEKKLARSLRSKEFFLLLFPLLVLATAVSASILLNIPWLLRATPLVAVLLTAVAILESRLYSPRVKKARLEADTEASALTGKRLFLDALRKIESIRLDNGAQLNAASRSNRPSGLPSITERIENLQGFPSRISGLASYPSQVESWWKAYAEEVIIDLASAPDEADRFFDSYDRFGLNGIVDYLRNKDLDLTVEDAKAVARGIIAEKDRLVRKAKEAREDTVGSEGEAMASQEDKEKSWIDRWLKR